MLRAISQPLRQSTLSFRPSPSMRVVGNRVRCLSTPSQGSSKDPTSPRSTSSGYGDKGRKATAPWLSDKSLYPLLAVVGVTVAFAAYFFPTYVYNHPENQMDPVRRRSTLKGPKREYEAGVPRSQAMYEKAQDMTNSIYRVTIKDEEAAEPGDHVEKPSSSPAIRAQP